MYTRLKGVPRDKRKEFIIAHLTKNNKGKINDFKDIFPELTGMDIANLLRELRRAGRIVHEGSQKKGFWRLIK
jgi:ATP-dependent DNA helicase RecG